MGYTDDFINKVKAGAIASMQNYGVVASITIAQAILESGWGKSKLTTECNNLFGVKAIGGWRGDKKLYPTYEYYNGKRVQINDYFRVYKNYTDSINDHALFLVNNSRYKENGFFNSKDYIGQANALLRAGYATAPNYARQLIQLIEQYNLQQYDTKTYSIALDGGGYADYKGSPAINLIIKDFSREIDRIFAWVDSDKGASFAFAKEVPNTNYTKLNKNCNKVITVRNGGYTFTKGAIYKITAKGYDKKGNIITTNYIVLKIPQK